MQIKGDGGVSAKVCPFRLLHPLSHPTPRVTPSGGARPWWARPPVALPSVPLVTFCPSVFSAREHPRSAVFAERLAALRAQLEGKQGEVRLFPPARPLSCDGAGAGLNSFTDAGFSAAAASAELPTEQLSFPWMPRGWGLGPPGHSTSLSPPRPRSTFHVPRSTGA